MIEIVQTDAEQPWHVRLRSEGNSEDLYRTTENYVEERGAVEALVLLGRQFSPADRARYRANDVGGVLHVWLDESDDEGGLFIPVQTVDEREAQPHNTVV